jgi:hypothetical protein
MELASKCVTVPSKCTVPSVQERTTMRERTEKEMKRNRLRGKNKTEFGVLLFIR